MLANIIIIAVIAVICILCVRSIIKSKKNGCSDCGSSCGGSCSGCSSACGAQNARTSGTAQKK